MEPIPDYQEELAYHLLSSFEAWDATPKDHRADTPARYVKMLHQMLDREEYLFTMFPAKGDEMVILQPISFYTFCAHHVVPFFGHVYIGYVPDKWVAGLSKFPRAVKYISKGFHIQEELTVELADFLDKRLAPKGLAVVLEAEHLCAAMRGVEERGMKTITSCMKGVFSEHDKTAKAEFLQFINSRRVK